MVGNRNINLKIKLTVHMESPFCCPDWWRSPEIGSLFHRWWFWVSPALCRHQGSSATSDRQRHQNRLHQNHHCHYFLLFVKLLETVILSHLGLNLDCLSFAEPGWSGSYHQSSKLSSFLPWVRAAIFAFELLSAWLVHTLVVQRSSQSNWNQETQTKHS